MSNELNPIELIKGFLMKCKNLEVWQKSSKICSEIYIYFKECNDYGFKDQITRSSLSVPSNIAEGIERNSDKDTIRFLDISKASIAEVQTQIYIGMKISYVDLKIGNYWINEYDEISKMISGLMKYYKSSLVQSS